MLGFLFVAVTFVIWYKYLKYLIMARDITTPI
jgi:hypothetical protein